MDEIDRELAELESNVQALDAYTKSLGLQHITSRTTPLAFGCAHERCFICLLGACARSQKNPQHRQTTEVRFKKITKVLAKA